MKFLALKFIFLVAATTLTAAQLAAATGEPSPGNDAETIQQHFDRQRAGYPQEKIHVTTDRETYMAGDTIWLRALLVDATTHIATDGSVYVYIELRDQHNEVAQRVKLAGHKGQFAGHIPLDVKTTEGEYFITAYTKYMESVGEEYFFKKRVTIRSPYSAKISIRHSISVDDSGRRILTINAVDRSDGTPVERQQLSITYPGGKIKNFGSGSGPCSTEIEEEGDLLISLNGDITKFVNTAAAVTDFDVSFHPEGGYIIPGIACKVAFKAIDSSGLGIDVTGIVTDQDGNQVTTLRSQHLGMGIFTIFAQPGAVYQATISTSDGLEKTFTLPTPNAEAAVLHLDATRSDGIITATAATAHEDGQYRLIVAQRGQLILAGEIHPQSTVAISSDSIPEGIAQFILTDIEGNSLSQRLVFSRKEHPQCRVKPINEPYKDRSLVTLEIDFSQFNDIGGSLAVAVTDNSTVARDTTINILTNLLLQSELKGYIENPAYYFNTSDPATIRALDLLMLTQGWTRYDLPEVIKGKYTAPTVPMEFGQLISGTLRSYWKNKPIADGVVTVITKKPVAMQQIVTDADGRFYCAGLNMPDSTLFIIQAKNSKGKTEENLEIDEQVFPEISPFTFARNTNADDSLTIAIDDDFLKNEYYRLNASGVLTVLLDEVTISAQKKSDADELLHSVMFDKSADYQYFEQHDIKSYEQALRKFSGLRIVAGNLTYRRSKVAFVVDGIVFDYESEYSDGSTSQLRDLQTIAPFDQVKRIDFVLPGQAGVPGSLTGYGGVLLITTKDGSEKSKPRDNDKIKTIMPLGYQRPSQFYNPRYVHGYTGPVPGGDLRSTLYWNPAVKINMEGKIRFSFFANDSRNTTYCVIAEGITATGQLMYARANIVKH